MSPNISFALLTLSLTCASCHGEGEACAHLLAACGVYGERVRMS